MVTLIRERSGLSIDLPSGPPNNAGGEGKLYFLPNSDECVKIYHQPLNHHEIEKLHFLSSIRHKLKPGFAWPIELVRMANETTPCGFVMPLIMGETLEDINDSRKTIPIKRAIAICEHIATYVENAHRFQHGNIILGDVLKAGNLMISDTSISFIDCASVSLTTMRFRNGFIGQSVNRYATPGYTAPERLDNPNRSRSTTEDLFALSVLFFEVIYGMAPHKPKPTPATIGYNPDEYVRKQFFFQFVDVPGMDAPTYPNISLPYAIDSLFRAAFFTDKRPSAAQWADAFRDWHNQMVLIPKVGIQHKPVAQPQGTNANAALHGVAPTQPAPHPIPFSPVGSPTQQFIHQHHNPLQPLTPINKVNPPIKVTVPTISGICSLLIGMVKLTDSSIRRILYIPRIIIETVFNGINDIIDYCVSVYTSSGGRVIKVSVLMYITLLGYRLIAADLNAIHPSEPSSSNTVYQLVQAVFGPNGYIKLQKSKSSQDSKISNELPPPPSMPWGSTILDEVFLWKTSDELN